VTPSGIEPSTFRQRLNQLRHRCLLGMATNVSQHECKGTCFMVGLLAWKTQTFRSVAVQKKFTMGMVNDGIV
jgi:hypothetical protein